MGTAGGERDLDEALVALIETALGQAGDDAVAPSDARARLVARAVAAGLRELVRAPLREALQAGYDLGWRAAQDAQRRAVAPGDGWADAASVASRSAAPSVPPAPAPPDLSPADTPAPPEAPRHVLVEAGPFPGFSAVNRFHAAVAAAPGVGDATIVSFRDGRLSLRVEHPDGPALAVALQALDLGALRQLDVAPERVALELGAASPQGVYTAPAEPAADAWTPPDAARPRTGNG